MNVFPKVVPNVYETSDGKLHTDEAKAAEWQAKLNFQVPYAQALEGYRRCMRHHSDSYRNNYINGDVFLNCLKEAGLSIVRTDSI